MHQLAPGSHKTVLNGKTMLIGTVIIMPHELASGAGSKLKAAENLPISCARFS